MVDEHLAEAVARALAPGGEHDLAPGLLQRRDVRDQRVEDVDVAGGALGGEGAPGAPAEVDRRPRPPAARRRGVSRACRRPASAARHSSAER